MRKIILTAILASASIVCIKAQDDIALITNGSSIQIQEVPYQISIQNKSGGEHFCGGSIINNKYVLTAAHCFFKTDNSRVNASEIKVKAGFSSQKNPGSNVQSYNAKRLIIHPNYNRVTLDYDIALIEIDGTFSFNTCVQPVKLISSQNTAPEATGNKVRVSGWGQTVPNRESPANQLQAVDVSIISNKKAGKQLGQLNISASLTQRMIATGANGVNRKGACIGDSGGPLVFKQNGQNDIQIGVVSWGVKNCVGGKNSPTIYTRLSKLVGWVNDKVWNNIEGSSQVCYNSSKVFTLQSSVPDFINVTWEVSPKIKISSSNNTCAYIKGTTSDYKGNGWVKATLSNGVTLKKDFWIGKPEAYTRFAYPICTSVFLQRQPNPFSLPVSPGATSYRLVPNSYELYVDTYPQPETEISMFATMPGNYRITLTTSNPCGSSQATIYVRAVHCNQSFFSTYPNPADNYLTIEKKHTEKTSEKTSSMNFKKSIGSFKLYNFNSELVLSGQLKNLTNIDVSNLREGKYILKIHTNGNIERHQIIIK